MGSQSQQELKKENKMFFLPRIAKVYKLFKRRKDRYGGKLISIINFSLALLVFVGKGDPIIVMMSIKEEIFNNNKSSFFKRINKNSQSCLGLRK